MKNSFRSINLYAAFLIAVIGISIVSVNLCFQYRGYKLLKRDIRGSWTIDDIDAMYIYDFYPKDRVKIESGKLIRYILLMLNSDGEEGVSFPVTGSAERGFFVRIILNNKNTVYLRIRIDPNSDIIFVSTEYFKYSSTYWITATKIGKTDEILREFIKACNCP